MTSYDDEARERWGETQSYKEFERKTAKYSPADFQAARVDQEAATELFVIAFGNGYATNSLEAQQAVAAHREAISKWFYSCSVEIQKQLAAMYIADPRFKEYYEGRVRGLAQYVHDSIMTQ